MIRNRILLPFLLLLSITFGCKEKPLSHQIMSFNIRVDIKLDDENSWKRRRYDIGELIQMHQPDIVGMQEVMPNQLYDLIQSLPEYNFIAIGREKDKKGEQCPIFYKRDKYRLLQSGCFSLSDSPEEFGIKGWDAAYNRIATWVELQSNINGTTLFILNTHLDNEGEIARLKGVELIAKRVKEMELKCPIIITGDMNVEIDNPVMEYITKELGLVDSRSISTNISGPNGTFHAFGAIPKEYRPAIDFILVPEKSHVPMHKIFEDSPYNGYMSDHYPIFTTIVF